MDVRIESSDALQGVPVICVPSTGIAASITRDGRSLPPDVAASLRAYLATSTPSSVAGAIERLAVPRVLLVGIGAGSAHELRRAGAAIARSAQAESTIIGAPTQGDQIAALTEGLRLGGYRFRAAGAARRARASHRRSASIAILDGDAAAITRGSAFAEATIWARGLANTRSDIKTPTWVAEQARSVLSPLGVRVVERDESWLAANHFGGIIATGSGSAAPPRLIEAHWSPRGAAAGMHVVLVGKCITFDTGGINIKPLDSMFSMYTDMAAAAAVLAAVRLVAELQVPIRVTALAPAAENSVSGSAMRPSDVVRHYGGRTSEIGNTDAEGRLVLADALAYAAAKLKPTVMIDLATLTGAMKVALGTRTGGLFATTDGLAAGLIAAGAVAGEPLWRMPLFEDYLPSLNSDVADANNSPGNPGAITAALFLRPFTAGLPWAHLDIAGPARASADVEELSAGATGFGARLLGEWLVRQAH